MALHLTEPISPNWNPPVLTCSALADEGLDEIWAQIEAHRETLAATGELAAKRQAQELRWMWRMVEDRLLEDLRSDRRVAMLIPGLEAEVRDGRLTAAHAAERVLAAFERR
jgi:LAO/AO transport system kinase